MEKARGAPEAVVEYSDNVRAILSQLLAVSDDDREMDQFGEEMVEKVMRELWYKMNGFGGAATEEMDGCHETDVKVAAEAAEAAMDGVEFEMVKVMEKQQLATSR